MEPKKNPAKDVHRYSGHFFLIGFSISLLMTIMAFEWRSKISMPPDCELPSPEMISYPFDVTPVIRNFPEPKPIKKNRVLDPNRITETLEIPTEQIDIPIADETPDTGIPEQIIINLPVEPAPDTFLIVEKMPLPVGGYEAFYKRVGKSIRYPAQAKRTGTDGKVFVEFVINERGEAVKFKIIKGIGSGCDEEAIRVLTMSKWEPGKQRGRVVNVKMTIPITFKLN